MRNTYEAVSRRLNDPAFARQLIQYLLYGFVGSLALNLLQSVAIFYEVTHRPHVKYIYHDSLGKPRELIVTDKAYYSDAEITNWATRKVTNLYTMNWLDYARHLDDSQKDFSIDAWNSWGQAFQGPGNIDFIKAKQVLLTASLKSAAMVADEGKDSHGNYQWHVTFPMYLRWVNASGEKTDVLSVKVTIERTNDPLHPDGLIITELNAPRAADGGA
ncbi:DotI/IcmL/TraM family protein [Acetobacter syzygii]|uniref:DotI n=1 Tax=Acetobacter syzygii TaxID=146476 RepID=A0A270B766_9PROT|nr:DotI/IcmL/TraM family protein [Acetobacter syzygii]NSL92710.1 DotI/IcmL/TraM family protein [Acetobacter syzygii]PAL20853.1 DotI [Acetobacter syzygii]PAL22922.1 DotI [Acetobacter syzygii]